MAPDAVDSAPIKKINFRPYLDIKIEQGNVAIMVIMNWRLKGKVDNQPKGAIIKPASPVVIILIFIEVIEKTWADASRKTLLFKCSKNLKGYLIKSIITD